MTLFDRFAQHSVRFTQRERQLVAYLLSKHPQGMLEPATTIAQKAGISPATVVRFFAKLGYPSFADAQREVRNEVFSKLASPTQRVELATRGAHSVESIIQNAFADDQENIHNTLKQLNMAEMKAIVRLLSQQEAPGRLFCLGGKNIFAVAHYLQTHLNLCRPNVILLDSRASSIADQLLWAQPGDVLFAITIRRYTRSVMQAAEYFHHMGNPVIAMADSPVAPITALADHRLFIGTSSASPFDSHTAAFSVCHALISAVAARRRAEVEATLQKGEEAWRHFDVFLEDGFDG